MFMHALAHHCWAQLQHVLVRHPRQQQLPPDLRCCAGMHSALLAHPLASSAECTWLGTSLLIHNGPHLTAAATLQPATLQPAAIPTLQPSNLNPSLRPCPRRQTTTWAASPASWCATATWPLSRPASCATSCSCWTPTATCWPATRSTPTQPPTPSDPQQTRPLQHRASRLPPQGPHQPHHLRNGRRLLPHRRPSARLQPASMYAT